VRVDDSVHQIFIAVKYVIDEMSYN